MFVTALMCLVCLASDSPQTPPPSSASIVVGHAPESMPEPMAEAVGKGVELLLEMQEGATHRGGPAEWPYQGVYRVGGKIPIGYQVGGTGICGEALLRAPGCAHDSARQAAIARAIDFVCASTGHELMTPEYRGGYDVRGWGYCYGLRFLLAARETGHVLEDQQAAVDKAIAFYTDALQQIEIPTVGGWTYSRRGIDEPCSVSPFMTAPCIQTLHEAAAQGVTVDPAVLERALDALELSRSDSSGNVAYSARRKNTQDASSSPGAMGRMTAVEGVLARSGRGTPEGIARSVRTFIDHWDELEKRRQKTGTHVGPYGVAPYYFFYAHYHVADVIELMPPAERAGVRDKVNELLFSVQEDNGAWNDRVFERSANYGTAMAMLAVMKPWLRAPAQAPVPPKVAPPAAAP